MTIAIASLSKVLFTVDAGEWAQTLVCANMVHYIAHLCKLLATSRALKHLISTTSSFVQELHLSITFSFVNDAPFLISLMS